MPDVAAAVKAVPRAEPAISKPSEPVVFRASEIVLSETRFNTWHAIAPRGMGLADLSDPIRWAAKASSFSLFDHVWIVAHDRTWIAHVLIADRIPGKCVPLLLEHWKLPPRLAESDSGMPSGHVLGQDPDNTWFCVRELDGVRIVSGQPDRETARRAAFDHATIRGSTGGY